MSRERVKGLAGEREVVQAAHEAGFTEARRSGDAGQWDHEHEDVIGLPTIRMSVKRQERLRLDDWSRAVEAQADEGEIPTVAYRRSREPWRVSMPLSDFLRLLSYAEEWLGR